MTLSTILILESCQCQLDTILLLIGQTKRTAGRASTMMEQVDSFAIARHNILVNVVKWIDVIPMIA